MNHQAFITDLDGTLLRSDQTLSPYTLETIESALRQDVVVTFATARGYVSAMQVVSDIPWKHPLILYNGALIYNGHDGTVIDGYWLDHKISSDIIRIGKKHRLTPFYFSLDADHRERVLHETLCREGETAFYQSRMNDPRFMEVAALHCPEGHRTLALTYIGLFDELEPIRREVHDCFGDVVHAHMMPDYYIRNHYFLEFSHVNGNKRDGLRLWADHMGIPLQNTVVFGDHLNDLGLFEAGGTRIAVRNAHERIQELADLVVDSNDADGVARYIRKQLELAGTEDAVRMDAGL